MAKRKKKMSKEARATMPWQHGIGHDIALQHSEKKHRNRKKYDRKRQDHYEDA